MGTRDRNAALPHQGSLFGDTPQPEASALVAVTPVKGRLSTGQRTFNRLTDRIRRLRETLAGWDAFIPRFQQRVASELKPIEDAIRVAQKQFVLQLDALLAATGKEERLTRRHRAKVRALLVDVAANLLQDEPDPEVEALHDRYSDFSHAEQRLMDVEIAEAMVEELFGPEATEGHEAQSVEELLHHAGERIAENEARARAKSEPRSGRGGRRQAAEEKAQAAREAAILSVREVYRKLASALHPDRETDPAERERKTALMQRANHAYARNDLLELLALQIETEQIDAGTLASMPEARLAHYNHVLQEQTEVLASQIEERIAVYRVQFDLTTRAVTQRMVEQALSATVIQARAALEEIERESKRLADPRERRAALNDLPEPEDGSANLEQLASLAAIFDNYGPPARPTSRAKKRKQRKR